MLLAPMPAGAPRDTIIDAGMTHPPTSGRLPPPLGDAAGAFARNRPTLPAPPTARPAAAAGGDVLWLMWVVAPRGLPLSPVRITRRELASGRDSSSSRTNPGRAPGATPGLPPLTLRRLRTRREVAAVSVLAAASTSPGTAAPAGCDTCKEARRDAFPPE